MKHKENEKLLSDVKIDENKPEVINDIGEEDELHLNDGIDNRKINTITLVLTNTKISKPMLVRIKMTTKMTIMLVMMTRIVLTMTWKGIKPFRITTISYLKMVVFLIVIWIVKILMAATLMMGVTVI